MESPVMVSIGEKGKISASVVKVLSISIVCDCNLLLNTQATNNEINAMIKLGGGNAFHDGGFWYAFTYKDMENILLNQGKNSLSSIPSRACPDEYRDHLSRVTKYHIFANGI
jgi:hypothetical protein